MPKIFGRLGCVLTIVVVVTFLGCGERGNEKESHDNPVKESESEPIRERILGNWKGHVSIDDAAFEKFMKDDDPLSEVISRSEKLRSQSERINAQIKKQMLTKKIYISFSENGTGNGGEGPDEGPVRFDEISWKIEKEDGDHAVIGIKDNRDKVVKLDATFQDDGTFIGKHIEDDRAMPFSIHFKRIEDLPQER